MPIVYIAYSAVWIRCRLGTKERQIGAPVLPDSNLTRTAIWHRLRRAEVLQILEEVGSDNMLKSHQ